MNEKEFDRATYIRDLGLSVRTICCLDMVRIRTLGDLEEHINNVDTLFKIKNMGKKSVDELINLLIKMGVIKILDEGEIEYYFDIPFRKRQELLDTQLYKLGIHCSDYFEDLSYLPKTLGGSLLYLSDNDNLSKSKNKEKLSKIIDELKLPNIYFGMPEEEINNLVVTDEMLVLLDEVINNVSLKQQLKNNENTIAYTSQVREENLSLESRVKESASKVNEQNKEVISQIKESITEDKEQLEAKKALLLELQKLSQEKQKLVEMNNQLDAEINQIMVDMYGAFEYEKRK